MRHTGQPMWGLQAMKALACASRLPRTGSVHRRALPIWGAVRALQLGGQPAGVLADGAAYVSHHYGVLCRGVRCPSGEPSGRSSWAGSLQGSLPTGLLTCHITMACCAEACAAHLGSRQGAPAGRAACAGPCRRGCLRVTSLWRAVQRRALPAWGAVGALQLGGQGSLRGSLPMGLLARHIAMACCAEACAAHLGSRRGAPAGRAACGGPC